MNVSQIPLPKSSHKHSDKLIGSALGRIVREVVLCELDKFFIIHVPHYRSLPTEARLPLPARITFAIW